MKLYSSFLTYAMLPAADFAMGTQYSRYRRIFHRLSAATREDVHIWQRNRLAHLVRHAYQHVPFYRDFMDREGIKESDIRTSDDLNRFPILTKEDIQRQPDAFVPDNLSRIKYMRSATGGSTGTPFQYLLSYEAQSAIWSKRMAVLKRYGFTMGEKYLSLGSTSINPSKKTSAMSDLFHKAVRIIPLSAARIDDEMCREAIRIIKRQNIRMIYGYASALYLLAKYIEDHRVALRVELCISTSEMLTDYYAKTIVRALGCTLINEYGARDGGLLSCKCHAGRFHVIETCLFRIAGGGKEGPILTTNLINMAMPLINYQVGDIIKQECDMCTCGDPSQAFDDVVGRSSQYMTLSNGKTITGPAFTVLFSEMPVKYYQIVQSGPCSITVRIEKLDGFTRETEETIIGALRRQAGETCSIQMDYNHVFAPLRNGKLEYFVTK